MLLRKEKNKQNPWNMENNHCNFLGMYRQDKNRFDHCCAMAGFCNHFRQAYDLHQERAPTHCTQGFLVRPAHRAFTILISNPGRHVELLLRGFQSIFLSLLSAQRTQILCSSAPNHWLWFRWLLLGICSTLIRLLWPLSRMSIFSYISYASLFFTGLYR